MRFIYIMLAGALSLASCCGTGSQSVEVVPLPNEITVRSGHFDAAGAKFSYSRGMDLLAADAINGFAARLSAASGKESTVSEGELKEGFIFIVDNSFAEEAYGLTVGRKAVEVRASSFRGFNYAIQTLKQMLPVEIFGGNQAADKKWTLQCAEINDAPRFSYRGLHLDVSRHFFTIDEVKKYIDLMELHKMNSFHWHLTDDQGWRIEIKKYPRLTEVGSIRKGTVVKKNWEDIILRTRYVMLSDMPRLKVLQ